MAVSAKAQVKKILGSKSFTGKQAARLVLKDSVEVDHGRPGILTTNEIQRLKQGIQGREVDVYNSWVRAYPLLDFSTKEATIMALQVERRLLALHAPMIVASLSEGEQSQQALSRPILVTQKQLEDIERDHREKAANGLESFTSVAVSSADDFVKEAAEKYPEASSDIEDILHVTIEDTEGIPGFTREEAEGLQDEIFRASALRLLELAEAGKLTPFTLTEAELAKRRALQRSLQGAYADDPLGVQALSKKLGAFDAATSVKGLNRATPKKTAALVKRIRDALEDGSLTFQEEPEWLESVFFRGQNLIEAKLPWFAWWAENFKENQFQGYAVVLDPKPHQLDENGHFLGPKNALLPGATREEALKGLEDTARTLHEIVVKAHATVRKQLRHVLGYQAVIEAVSEAIGVDFGEDIREAWSGLTSTLKSHHELLEVVSGWHRLKSLATLKLDIEALKPSKKMEGYIRERLSLALGDSWWDEVATALNKELEASDA